MNRVRWQLDKEGRVTAWSPDAAAFFHLPAEEALGRPCGEVVAGTDRFGRPLCVRCPVQREIKRGAYQASTPVCRGGKRLTCQGYVNSGIQVELKPENHADPSEVLASLSWAVRKLAAEPGSFFQTLQVFLGSLRRALGMEAAELFLADPQEHYLVLTAYDGVHREAFLEKAWFAWGEGFPGLVSLLHHPLLTHDLPSDARYLRQKVKKLGYKTYVCYPLELPQGLIGVLNLASRDPDTDDEALLEQLTLVGPMLAASLYTVLTRLGEAGLRSVASALHAQSRGQGIEAFLEQSARLSGASCVRLLLADGETYSHGKGSPPACAHAEHCEVWQGQILGVRGGVAACPHVGAGQPRQCLPLWSGPRVVGLQQLFFTRLPPIASQAVAPVLWLERLGAEVLWPEHQATGPAQGHWLELRTFGGLQVRREGQVLPPKAFGRRQALTLLKLLLAHRGQTLARDELCERLWPGEEPEATQARLHVLVHDLRQALEPDPAQPRLILREGEGYRFAPQVPYFLDVERFEQLIHQGDGLGGTAALEAYRQALLLYKGDFLCDEPYADWAELERAYLRERAVGALLRSAEIARALGQSREALEAYRFVLKLDPWREEAYRALMQQLVESGQKLEAKSLFSQYQTRMEREGLPIDPDLARLVQPA
ncbi:BTAD domain-containing putative transcriptional regulator [Calidithermus chliarophilus]|uniref:BTAD domain-containing putative transcriptional regulator n=1 Tax=Calidithermus chliarophilus TaxID=52023 RepID=UPI00040C01CE|nr:BTAD domain-containing putative transcriptional regulator [Calidithermus chliarophilus]